MCVQGVVRKFREVVDRASEGTGEAKIIMAVNTGLPHHQLAALYGNDIGMFGNLLTKKLLVPLVLVFPV